MVDTEQINEILTCFLVLFCFFLVCLAILNVTWTKTELYILKQSTHAHNVRI